MAGKRWYLLFLIAAVSCGSHRYISKEITRAEQDFKDHIGFVLYDPNAAKVIFDHQGDRYFTPASNTKIFTLYVSLRLLGDSIPALRYAVRGDSMIFWGTGDPGFLYENTEKRSDVYDFLKNSPGNLFFSSSNFQSTYLGAGWSWDDYAETYQVERTPFPVFGNRALITKVRDKFISKPDVFVFVLGDSSQTTRSSLVRSIDANIMTYHPGKTNRPLQWRSPVRISDEVVAKVLSDTLKREVRLTKSRLPIDAQTVYSSHPDSLYKVLMQSSDNFIAEQLLLLCSNAVSDTLKPEIAIRYAKKNLLNDLPDAPVWVDGSGLSRYNLFTPRSMVKLWDKIYAIVPRQRLFEIVAVGGKSGTLRNYYKGDKGPFIFGKTGFLANNYTLSGYMVTKQGRTLIFSWMNNNFTGSASEVRARMELILKTIYEKN
jgi:D-alanyl-D-alanine carboxypeptidase/D-alanyl-D-alanine-endopeptidase (penicillin-binding protein 4)